jgi:hypothetical protein
MQKEIRPKFDSFVKKVCDKNEIIIVTHQSDDFGIKSEVHNIISFDEAFTILEKLQDTLAHYIPTNEYQKS